MIRYLYKSLFIACLSLSCAWADQPMVNVYAWTGEIPSSMIQQFERETGIKVNFSEYENNEIMYAKLRAVPRAGYDIIMPSTNLLYRMSRKGMLQPIDKARLSNWKNMHPHFLNPHYDPHDRYGIPFIWGVTGLFVNNQYHKPANITRWQDLWQSEYKDQLLLLDDMRDVFAMALFSLGFDGNDEHPEHIKAAFLKLRALMPNVKMFSTDTTVSMIIDEDATLGMAWNGDTFKASQENPHIQFIYPKEGFTIWVDSFAIPKNAPHPDAAYQFLNFMLRGDIAKQVTLSTGYAVANQAGLVLLPKAVKQNPMIYPPEKILRHGQYQLDLPANVLEQYEQYWEELKMRG
jgi:spermidine/putrescine transport system substrate-binding protein